MATLSTAQSFAALSIEAFGRQSYDIATNITHLPDGGRIIDEVNKLVLNASEISYHQGVFIKASEATIQGEFGALSSPYLEIDLPSQTLTGDSIALSYKNLALSAKHILLFLGPNIARLEDEVISLDPSFVANSLIINLKTGFGILLSPFSYQNGPLVLKQESSDKNLQLSPSENADGSLSYQASSIIDPSLLESFRPYLKP